MTTQPNIRKRHTVFIAVLFFSLLSGMATPAAATPYTVLIEDPGVWKITGTFESLVNTWTEPEDVFNWEFHGEVTGQPDNVLASNDFTVGPFNATRSGLNRIMGSSEGGITRLMLTGPSRQLVLFDTTFVENQYEITFFGRLTPPNGLLFERGSPMDITNAVAAVPEPTTALLFLTGLAGLAGYRWHQGQRKAN